MDYQRYVIELLERGVTVIPIHLSAPFSLMMFLLEQQEFIYPDINGAHDDGLVLGGFGAYGNPSSFHHPEVRRVRMEVYTQLISFFQQYGQCKNLGFLQMLFDRFCVRRKGTQPTAEKWHRDISPHKTVDGIVLGGWINLDTSNDQYFSCIPSSHTLALPITATGFVTLDSSMVDKTRKELIRIPPSHLILFNQDLVHEVCAKKSPINSCRLFMGWSLSCESTSLFPNVEEVMNSQAVPELPSGQIPPLFSKSHVNYYKAKVDTFLQNIKPVFLEHPRHLYGKYVRELTSLQEAHRYDPSITLFPDYDEVEKLLYLSSPLFP